MIDFREGMLIENKGALNWGPGKIIHVSGANLHIVFRDLEQDMARIFRADAPSIRLAPEQSDAVLDNLPPLKEREGHWFLPSRRYPLEELKRKFLHHFPAGFSDSGYLQVERTYKPEAHLVFHQNFGHGEIHALIAARKHETLAKKALQVLAKVNLLSPYESAAFHDAMRDSGAVVSFFDALSTLLEKTLDRQICEHYLNVVSSLPAARGQVATWPVATIFPYLAEPDHYMFLKPKVSQTAADALGFDLKYSPTLNWTTFKALHRMGSVYLNLLRALGARDFVDVQSFFWVSTGGYDDQLSNQAVKEKPGASVALTRTAPRLRLHPGAKSSSRSFD